MKTLVAFVVGLIAAPLLLTAAAMAGWLPSDATSEPPRWESSIGMRALDTSLEKRSSELRNPIAASDSAALASGEKIYLDNCSGCHGRSKGPSSWGAKNMYPRAPQFFQEGADVSPSEAFAAIRDGIRYSAMGAWRGQMKEEDMWKAANFVATLRNKGGTKDMD